MPRKCANTALVAIMAVAAILAFAVSLGLAATTMPQRDLDGDIVPPAAFDAVIDTVGRNLEPLHRYVALRQKVLGLDPIHAWDLFVPVVKNIDLVVSFAEAREMMLAGLAPLGAGYRALVAAEFVSDWTGGDAHPYIHLDYDDTIDSLFTVAHESGHAIHLDQSSRSRPYPYDNYAVFVAEVASTTNEALMLEYLLRRETDRNNRLFILNKYLEKIRRSIYTQSMFAEFEKNAFELAGRGEALTVESLSALWGDLNKKYFGPDYVLDEVVQVDWGRTPRFYRSFDVYKNVIGLAAGTALAEKIATEGQPAVDRYLAFLRADGGAYPLDILQAAGVDMSTPAPLEAAIRVFERLLGEMEMLLKEQGTTASSA